MFVLVHKSSLQGKLQVPGSKSHTIRAILLATLSQGKSIINNPLLSGDGESAIEAAKGFGAKVTLLDHQLIIEGRGIPLCVPEKGIDTRNSGTTTSFVTTMATLTEGETFITGDEQIQKRPIQVLVDALRSMGSDVSIIRANSLAPPLIVKSGLYGGKVSLDGFNSQFVSSLLLSSPLARSRTEISVSNPLEKPYIQMTLDWMRRFGATVQSNEPEYTRFIVEGNQQYKSGRFTISSDWSAVAFPLVAALVSDSHLTITGLDFSDTQGDKRVVDLLIEMGADISKDTIAGTLAVSGGKKLKGGLVIDLGDIPDALPALCVASLCSDGMTTFTNLAHVRVKESDRVLVMAEELGKLGAKITIGDDHMNVYGGLPLHEGNVESHGDHRVAMALTAAALMAGGDVQINDASCTEVSYPNFFASFIQAGAAIVIHDDEVAP
ncbi:MAG TPA: 3-phosphoshikimate 1-carboxyvinyltransferase [Sphaerochaeta sp.]|nr:3-phosphoshikimate 1-carboxyvinyltransferase [Sphaerochaeta sp.]